MTSIFDTIREAKQALALYDCRKNGHKWDAEGQGCRCCCYENPLHSQTVYVCSECGEMDYGDPGGPGHDECVELGCREYMTELNELDAEYARELINGYQYNYLCELLYSDFQSRLLYIK